MPHHWGSLRVQFMLLVVLAAIPAFGITSYLTAQDRAREAVSAQANAVDVARLVAGEYERLTQETNDLLGQVGQEPAVRGHDEKACSAQLASLLSRYPVYANLMVFRPDGTLVCSGLPFLRPTSSIDSPWFQRVLSTHALTVGDYEADRVDGRSGQPIALSIRDNTGQVQLVLMAELDLEWLGDFIAKTQGTPDTSITLLDRKSTIVTRYPDPAPWTGKLWAAPGLRPSNGSDEAAWEGQDIDGSSRLFAAVPLGDPTAPVGSVVVGIPAEYAFAASTINFWRNVATIAVAAASVLGITWFGDKLLVGRQVRALAQATQAIAAGGVQTRTGLASTSGELRDLAGNIDQMAEALARRDKEREEMEAALVESEERYRDLFENATDLILSVAADGHFLYTNKAWRETLGYDVADSPKFFDSIAPEARADGESIFERAMAGEQMDQIELTFLAKDGHKILCEGSANCRFVDGRPYALRGIFRDVTSRKQAEAKLIYLSSHDTLTGLYSRGYFEEEMARLAHSRRLPISIVVADLDGLKQANDTLGHLAGDELLKQAARVLCSSFRQEDLIARIGGDEFGILLPQSDAAVAEEAIARVRQNMAAQNEPGKIPLLHLSLGTATASSGELLIEALKMADAAMYADKASRQTPRSKQKNPIT